MIKLHIDIETFSSVDIKRGVYPYTEAFDFEIMLVAYAVNDGPIVCYDWQDVPEEFFKMLKDPEVIKLAHNAAFERVCFKAIGYDVPPNEWRCTAVWSAYAGLPMRLKDVSAALELGEHGKQSTGAALIRYFCVPCKPTIINGGRTRNRKEHAPERWEAFKKYCTFDVVAEREIVKRLMHLRPPREEWEAYSLDQVINDRGVRIDTKLAKEAVKLDDEIQTEIKQRLKELTQLANPASVAQLGKWIEQQTGSKPASLAKGSVEALIEETTSEKVREVLRLRLLSSRSSVKKYTAALHSSCDDGRARGLFQFYGAGRTGRWAGRLIQLQNLRRNDIKELDAVREIIRSGKGQTLADLYDDVQDVISQLIRTVLIPTEGRIFAAVDFSAIEARVLSWIAGEEWRLEVFRTHGKIYEASASKMFNVPLESIGKGSPYRQKGKVAELALGYQGSVGALKAMGADRMGLSDSELKDIVTKWRRANPKIVKFWREVEEAFKQALQNGQGVRTRHGLIFRPMRGALQIELPSGRKLTYWSARLENGRIKYKGVDDKKAFFWLDTYGGKITENLIQAISRDLLLFGLQNLEAEGFYTVMHVHDEAVLEIDKPEELKKAEQLMATAPEWAKGLPLGADGYTCNYYKKD